MLIVLKTTGNNRARPIGERAFDMNFRVRIAIVITGFSGLVAEILLLRELLIVFAGNELSIGLILAGWLILEAAGCLLAAGGNRTTLHPPLAGFTAVNIGFSIALILAIGLTRILKNLMGLPISFNTCGWERLEILLAPVISMRSFTRCLHAPSITPVPMGRPSER